MFSKAPFHRLFSFSLRECLVSAGILFCAIALCGFLQNANSSTGFAFPVFTLAVLCISRFTTGYLFGLIAAVLGVICVNLIFTFPYWQFDFTLTGYPMTFVVFLFTSIMTSTLTTQVRQQERLRSENEKEKMRANLLRSVSHDIRTPLTSIVGSTSAVLENPGLSSAEQNALLEDVRTEAQYDIITGWFSDDGEIDNITIDGKKKFTSEDAFRPDVEIVINYHTLKKNKPA